MNTHIIANYTLTDPTQRPSPTDWPPDLHHGAALDLVVEFPHVDQLVVQLLQAPDLVGMATPLHADGGLADEQATLSDTGGGGVTYVRLMMTTFKFVLFLNVE